MTDNEGLVYASKLKEFCKCQSDCLGCKFHDKYGCKVGTPIGWQLDPDMKPDVWQTDIFKDGWREGYGMGKQELAHQVMKLFETNGV